VIKKLILTLSAIGISSGALAGGLAVDSHPYTCPALQSLIAAQGYVYIANPNFMDNVVANASFCSGDERAQVRSVPTIDNPQCLVNYCIPVFRTLD